MQLTNNYVLFVQNFNISGTTQFGIYDSEGSYVVLSDSIPDNAQFVVSELQALHAHYYDVTFAEYVQELKLFEPFYLC